MGTYLSIPFVSRKVIQIEPGKPVLSSGKGEAFVNQDVVNDVEKMPMTPIAEDKEDIKEAIEIIKDTVEKAVEKAEVAKEVEKKEEEMIISNLRINIPADDVPEPVVSNPVVDESKVEARLPEFAGNINSSSHAIKKFNRRHRKHQN